MKLIAAYIVASLLAVAMLSGWCVVRGNRIADLTHDLAISRALLGGCVSANPDILPDIVIGTIDVKRSTGAIRGGHFCGHRTSSDIL